MDISSIQNNNNYSLYNENTTEMKEIIDPSRRPREKIEAELAAAKAELAKLEEELAPLKKRLKELEEQLAADPNNLELLSEINHLVHGQIAPLVFKIADLEMTIDALEGELSMEKKKDHLPPKSDSDSSKPTGLFDLLRQEPKKLF